MKANAFVHIGFPKTGTTSIQKSLAASRDALKQHGITYPGAEDDHANLTALFHPKGPDHFYFSLRSISNPVRLGTQLLAEGLSSEGDLIFSSEYLHNIGEKHAQKLYGTLSDAGFRSKFICYVRHPVDAAVSSAQQSIKMGDRGLAEVIADPRYTFIQQNVEPFIRAVGKENVILKDFNISAREGLLRSFMCSVGRPELTEALVEIPANESLTMDAALFCDLHRMHLNETGRDLFPKSVIFQFTDGKFDLPVKTKEAVRAMGQKDIEWVETEFGITLLESNYPVRYHQNPSLGSVAKVIEAIRYPGVLRDKVLANEGPKK
ncbi:MAG: hypothetical protein KBE28_11345 [Nitrospira sp.]|nr:hypothetical protein [Nitrospira sp.]